MAWTPTPTAHGKQHQPQNAGDGIGSRCPKEGGRLVVETNECIVADCFSQTPMTQEVLSEVGQVACTSASVTCPCLASSHCSSDRFCDFRLVLKLFHVWTSVFKHFGKSMPWALLCYCLGIASELPRNCLFTSKRKWVLH